MGEHVILKGGPRVGYKITKLVGISNFNHYIMI